MSILPPITIPYIREKWQHTGFQKYFQNMTWAFAGRFISLLLSFFIGALVARHLGPARYGDMNYAISFVTIFSFLASFGIDNILTRDLVKSGENKEKILNTAFGIKIIGGILVIFISTLVSLVVNDKYITLLVFIYSLHLLFYSFSVIDSYFQSIIRYKYTFIAQFISVILVSIIKLFLIYKQVGTGWFILAIMLDTAFTTLVYLYIFKRQKNSLKIKLDTGLAKKMILDSWPFVFTGAFFLIYAKIDQVMIGKMLEVTQLGIYAAGGKLAEIWYFIPGIISSVLFPAIVKAKTIDATLYKKRLINLLKLIFLISFVIALIECIFAPFLVWLIFGSAYSDSAIILRIYTWAGILVAVTTVLNQYLTIENRARLIMFSALAGAVSNVILNIIFIPRYGITGAAWATIISYSLVPIFICLSIKSPINKLNKWSKN